MKMLYPLAIPGYVKISGLTAPNSASHAHRWQYRSETKSRGQSGAVATWTVSTPRLRDISGDILVTCIDFVTERAA